MFKSTFVGNYVLNTISFKFKYFVDIGSKYEHSYESKPNTIQNTIIFPNELTRFRGNQYIFLMYLKFQ